MLRTLAILSGIILIIMGIMGFLPDFVQDGKLFNLFKVNLEHNIAYLSTGLIALLAGISSTFASRIFFIIAGVVYLFLAFMGLVQGQELLFGIIAVNTEDNYLHLAMGLIFLLIGFRTR